MPVIISVHGTNDSGSGAGDRWWQRGSVFANEIEASIEGEHGEVVRVEPFIWDGRNSETSRRSAGKALYRRLAQLEAENTAYCLVGHSHGGSVIGHALLECGLRGERLPNLSAWLTVGTPFVQCLRKRSMFARLNLIGRAMYAMALTLAIVPLVYLLVKAVVTRDGSVFYDLGDTVVQFGLPFLLFLTMTLALEWLDSRRYRRSLLRKVDADFDGRWHPLNHEDDEAIQGLIATGGLRGRIFADGFLVSMFQIAVLAASITFVAGGVLASQTEVVDRLPFLNQPVFQLSHDLLLAPQMLFTPTIESSDWPLWLREAFTKVLLIGLAPAILYFLVIIAALVITELPIFAWSASGARSLSATAWRQIRQLAFGGDCLAEVAVGAGPAPAWRSAAVPALPAELSDQLSTEANEAAARAIAKFRAALSSFAYSVSEPSHRDFVADYLTWRELIHTAYFRNALFRKLVCYMISHLPGFRAKPGVPGDDQIELLERWHNALALDQSKASASASG